MGSCQQMIRRQNEEKIQQIPQSSEIIKVSSASHIMEKQVLQKKDSYDDNFVEFNITQVAEENILQEELDKIIQQKTLSVGIYLSQNEADELVQLNEKFMIKQLIQKESPFQQQNNNWILLQKQEICDKNDLTSSVKLVESSRVIQLSPSRSNQVDGSIFNSNKLVENNNKVKKQNGSEMHQATSNRKRAYSNDQTENNFDAFMFNSYQNYLLNGSPKIPSHPQSAGLKNHHQKYLFISQYLIKNKKVNQKKRISKKRNSQKEINFLLIGKVMFVSNKKSYILKKEYEETKMTFLFIEYSSLFYNK